MGTAGPLVSVIDVETTGLHPDAHHRIIEIAAVCVDAEGNIERQFCSLVNPRRDLGPTSIHGISAAEALAAPGFEDVLEPLVDTLRGAVCLAAHNARFDIGFLTKEFQRAGLALPRCPSICTLTLLGGGKLRKTCEMYGVAPPDTEHDALADAIATARLVGVLLRDHPEVRESVLQAPPISWPAVPRSSRQPIARAEARRESSKVPSFLSALVERLPSRCSTESDESALLAYSAVLDSVLEDRRIDPSESAELVSLAQSWGLSISDVRAAHREYLRQLAVAALSDGVVSELERRDLEAVSRLLGEPPDSVARVLSDAEQLISQRRSASSAVVSRELGGGRTVCFTGTSNAVIAGEPATRELLHFLAEQAGFVIQESVTKKLDLLVVADPHTQSGKARTARKYGIEIVPEAVFLRRIGVQG